MVAIKEIKSQHNQPKTTTKHQNKHHNRGSFTPLHLFSLEFSIFQSQTHTCHSKNTILKPAKTLPQQYYTPNNKIKKQPTLNQNPNIFPTCNKSLYLALNSVTTVCSNTSMFSPNVVTRCELH